MIPYTARIPWPCASGLHGQHWLDVVIDIDECPQLEHAQLVSVFVLARQCWRTESADKLGHTPEAPAIGQVAKGRDLLRRDKHKLPGEVRRELVALAVDSWWADGESWEL